MRGREKFNKYKHFINLIIAFYKIFPIKTRVKLFYRSRMTRGLRGIAIRYALLKTIAKKCGDNVKIDTGVYFFNPHNAEIGNNVSINPMCYIEAKGGLKIGDDVSIAHGVTIMTTSHTYGDITRPIKEQKVEEKQVEIEDNVWIGAKAMILYGRTIKSGSIVGASAVVTHDVGTNKIVVGNPAKEIKERS